MVRGSDNLIWDGGAGLFISPPLLFLLLLLLLLSGDPGLSVVLQVVELRHQLLLPPQHRPPRPEGGGSWRSTPGRVRPVAPPAAAGSLLGSFFAAGAHRRTEISTTQNTVKMYQSIHPSIQIHPCDIQPSVLYPFIQPNTIISFLHLSI